MNKPHISTANLLLHSQELLSDRHAKQISRHLLNCSSCSALQHQITYGLGFNEKDMSGEEIRNSWTGILEQTHKNKLRPHTTTTRKSWKLRPPLTAARRQQNRRWLLTAASFLLFISSSLIFLNLPSQWQPSQSIICRKKGAVLLKKPGSDFSIPEKGTKISANFSIKTAKNTFCDLQIAKNSGLRIMDDTVISIESLKQHKKSDQKQITILLKTGLVIARVDKKQANTMLSLKTPHGIFKILGTRFALNVNKKESRLYLFKGKIRIKNRKKLIVSAVSYTSTDKNNTTALSEKNIHTNLKRFERLSRTIRFSPHSITIHPSQRRSHQQRQLRRKKRSFTEKLILNDGLIISGTILIQQKEKIVIRTAYGTITIKKSDIRKIIYLKK